MIYHFASVMALVGLFFLACFSCKPKNETHPQSTASQQAMKLNYPSTHKDSIIDDYFGQKIQDPYRWLEDDHSQATGAWVAEQNKLTFSYLDRIPFRNKLKSHLEKLFNFEKCSVPYKHAGKYYFFKNNGLQNQDVLYTSDSLHSTPKVLLDPNLFSSDGTSSLSAYAVSKNGQYIAYQSSDAGSDWNTIYVKNIKTGEQLKDSIRWVKFSGISWKNDGFYYCRYPEPKGSELSSKNEYHALYFHKLGTAQSQDKLIYSDKTKPNKNIYATVSYDENFLILSASESTSGNTIGLQDLRKPNAAVQWLNNDYDNDFNFVGNQGETLFFHSNQDAERWNVFSISSNAKNLSSKNLVIAESQDVIESADLIASKLVLKYMHNASNQLKIFDLKGQLVQEQKLPELGTVGAVSGNPEETEMFYSFSSFVRPSIVYRLDLGTDQTSVYFKPKFEFNSDLYTTEQHWYNSKDGTKIPIFLTFKKGLKPDGKRPCLLYGYGGFNISVLPSFNATRLPILENDGIYAVANLRGGGEFGKTWHEAGILDKKQNVFDDFIAAADFLVAQNFTSRELLAVEGRSNGGLLIGACITQRPDLCKVAFPAVGVLDMLRYHKFTIGWAWATDYGTSENQKGFDALIRYSPLHNAKPAQYPATIITTGDHDDRVVPAHSFKFAAAMQEAQQSPSPMLIRIDVSAGHGAGKPTSKRIEEAADLLSFMFYQFGIEPKAE